MKDDSFDRMDESLMKGFKKNRDRKVPESILRGFSESVEKQILEAKSQNTVFGGGAMVFSISFVLIAAILLWQWPNLIKQVPSDAKFSFNEKTAFQESDIDSDVQVLKALGEWNEEDEAAMGIPVENAFAEFAEFDLDINDDGIIAGRNVGISMH